MDYGFNTAAANAVTKGMRPSEYMRLAQPELFSDSGKDVAFKLDRAVFEYHLDTLTSRNQHQGFEVFCRRLCERLICPNLKPSTGPEGGGDSKADTETVSVAEEIRELHYVGEPRSGQERWAFAFSAKAEWKAKVRKDVEGLAGTERGFEKVIFVTSRFAPAKARAALEDSLSAAHGLRVEIHDRSWIVKVVIDDGHTDLAVDHLGVGERVIDPRPGPQDYRRTQELNALERRIQDPTGYENREIERVADALSAALLSRNLERPRLETDGRFDRAIRLADRFGSARQKVETRYEQLWAAFYWFDDIDRLNADFDAVATLAYGSDDAETVELIANLVQNLANAVALGHAKPEVLGLDGRRKELVAKLETLAAERERPNNALEARTSLLFTEATRLMVARDAQGLRNLWPQFSRIIDAADGLTEYRASRLEPVIELFGRAAGRDEDYSALVEKLATFVSKRAGDARGGLIRLKRAAQLDIATDRLEIIRLLGTATQQLAQREHAENLVEATYTLAVAYRGAGLLWAARAAAMFALASLFSEAERDAELPVTVVPALELLGWIDSELRLLPELLEVIRLLKGCRRSLPLDEDSQARLDERLESFDASLAASLLHTSPADRKALTGLPDMLGGLELLVSQSALFYALGHREMLEVQGEDAPVIDWDRDLGRFADQLPVEIRERPLILNADSSQIQITRVLGMSVRVSTSGSPTAAVAAQTLLTVIEAAFATMLEAGVGAHVERFDVELVEDAGAAIPIFTIDEDRMQARMIWPKGASPTSPDLEGAVYETFLDFVVRLVLTACVVKDAMGLFIGLHEKEALSERISAAIASVNSRSRTFTTTLSRLEPWLEMGGTDYPLREDAPTVIGDPSSAPQPDGYDQADQDAWRRDHRQIQVRSILNFPLWEKAGWTGFMLGDYGKDHPPVMGLHFTDPALGRQIFADWRERFGARDDEGAIHIAILRDLPGHPASHYGALLTPGVAAARQTGATVMTTRLKILEPETDVNLRRFLEAYEREGTYWLMPAAVGPDGAPNLLTDLAILKRDLTIKRVADIQEDDVESIALTLLDRAGKQAAE